MKNKMRKGLTLVLALVIGLGLGATGVYAMGKWKGSPNVEQTHIYLDEIEVIISELKQGNADDVEYYEDMVKELTDLFNQANKLIAQRDDTINDLHGMINSRDNTINELTRIINELNEQLENAYKDVVGIEQRVESIFKENE